MQISVSLRGTLAGLSLCLGCSLPVGSSISARDEATLEFAELALARGEFERAVRSFDQVLERNPQHQRSLLGSARANLIAGRGEASLARYDAYRDQIDAWGEVVHREYCAAIAVGVEQAIESGERAGRALELAQRLEAENCAEPRTRDLILRSGLEVAERALEQGDDAHALEIYLSLASGAPYSDRESGTDPGVEESAVARAYLGAVKILMTKERREEALALLSSGLDKLPDNRDLVHRMLTVLADGSSVVFPRAKPPEESRVAAPE